MRPIDFVGCAMRTLEQGPVRMAHPTGFKSANE